jgi:hypothetical protein
MCEKKKPKTYNKEFPTANHYPLKIGLPNYKFKHSTNRFKIEKDEKDFIGRYNLKLKFFTWLKSGHNKPGSGEKHGCYLITGYRGVGKTAFVNIVIRHYEKWLKWLYGDSYRHLDEVHINLGAGRTSSEDILHTIADELYAETKENRLLVFLNNRQLWIFSFLVIFLATLFAQAIISTKPSQSSTLTEFKEVLTKSSKGEKLSIVSTIKTTIPEIPIPVNTKEETFSNNYFSILQDEIRFFLSWTARPYDNNLKNNSFARQIYEANSIIKVFQKKKLISWQNILIPLPLIFFIFVTLYCDWKYVSRLKNDAFLVKVPSINKIGYYLVQRIFFAIVATVIIFYIVNGFWKWNVCTPIYGKLTVFWCIMGLLIIIFAITSFLKHIHRSIKDHFTNHKKYDNKIYFLTIVTVLAVISFGNLSLLPFPLFNIYKVNTLIFMFMIIFISFLQLFNLKGEMKLFLANELTFTKKLYKTISDYFASHSTLTFSFMLNYLKLIFLSFLFFTYLDLLILFFHEESSILSHLLFLSIGIGGFYIKWLIITFPLVFAGGVIHYIWGERIMEPCFHKPGCNKHSENTSQGRNVIMEDCGNIYKTGKYLRNLLEVLKYQNFIRGIVIRLHNTIETQTNLFAQIISLTGKRTYLPYTPETLEYDIMRAIKMYNKAYPKKDLIIIFDELDKIQLKDNSIKSNDSINDEESHSEQIKAIRTILGNMKELLNAAEAKFIFVTGIEFYEHWLIDVGERVNLVGSQFAPPIVIPTFMTDTADSKNREISSIITKIFADIIVPEEISEKFIKALRGKIGDFINPEEKSTKKTIEIKDYLKTFPFFSGKDDKDTIKNLEEHLKNFPSMTLLAYFFSEDYKNRSKFPINQNFSDTDSEEYLPYYQTFAIRDFINYITFRSMGVPRSIYLYIDKFVEEGNTKRNLQLSFDNTNLHPVQLVSFILTLFHVDINESIKGHGDKIIMSSLQLLNFLCRFHKTAFDKNIIELIPDVITPYHSPEIRDIIQRIFNLFKSVCLVTIRNGVYSYKLTETLGNEIRYASLLDDAEMAAFNFSIEQNIPVRRYYEQQAQKAYKRLPNTDIKSITPKTISVYLGLSSVLCNLAQLYEYEEQYDKALFNYKRSIKYLRAAYPLPKTMIRGRTKASNFLENEFDISNITLIIRSFLRIGNVYERTHNYSSAYSYYAQARDYSNMMFKLFEEIKNQESEHEFAAKALPRILASPLILQPYFAIEYLLLKDQYASQGASKVFSIGELINHLESFKIYINTKHCCNNSSNDYMCKKTKCTYHEKLPAAKPHLCLDQNLQAMYHNILESLNYYISLCHTRKADMNFFSKTDQFSIKYYVEALKEQGNMLSDVADDIAATNVAAIVAAAAAAAADNAAATVAAVAAVNNVKKESLLKKFLGKWNIYQKENLALVLSHLSDAIFSCSNQRIDKWLEYEIKKEINKYDIIPSAFGVIPSYGKTHVLIKQLDENKILRESPFIGNAMLLAIYSSYMFNEANEYLRAGNQLNKIMKMLLYAITLNDTSEDDASIYTEAAEELSQKARTQFNKAYGHIIEWSKCRDKKLIKTISECSKLKADEEVGSEYEFQSPGSKESELIELQIKFKIIANQYKDNSKPEAINKNETIKRITKLAKYYAQQAFPARLKVRFMKLYGDMLKLLILIENPNDYPTILEYFVEGITAYKNALDILNTLGSSLSITHFSIAELHFKLAELLNQCAKQIKYDDMTPAEQLEINSVIDFASRAHDFPLSRSDMLFRNRICQYEQALRHYRLSISIHTQGQAYMDTIRQYCYLTDDFHGEEVHFSIAYETFMKSHSSKRIREIKVSIKEIKDENNQT